MKKLIILTSGLLFSLTAAFAQPTVTTPAGTTVATTTTTTTTRTEIDKDFHAAPYVALNANYVLNYENSNSSRANNSGIFLNSKVGYDFHPNVAAEFETGWQVRKISVDGNPIGALHQVPLFANLVLKAPVGEDRRLVPYLSGGFGVMLYGVNEKNSVSDVDIRNASVGFKTAVGADYWFKRNMAVNFETGYFFMPDPEIRVAGVTRDVGVDAWYIGAGLKFKFD